MGRAVVVGWAALAMVRPDVGAPEAECSCPGLQTAMSEMRELLTEMQEEMQTLKAAAAAPTRPRSVPPPAPTMPRDTF